jgi:hypothetical protein
LNGTTNNIKSGIVASGWWKTITAIGITFIAMGSASEAAFLVRDMYVEVYSLVSNQYEYDMLASINVGNTVAYAEDRLGYPQVSKAIDAETTANYFFTGEYLLTLFYQDNRIVGYTWVSVDNNFIPEMDLRNGELRAMGEFVFNDMPLEVKGYTLDDSRIVRYYLENLEGGRAAGFIDTYLGNVQYGAFEPGKAVSTLYQAEVVGNDREAETALNSLRAQTKPNLYGQGSLPLKYIEQSVLSNNEFTGYFGNN